MGQVDIKPKQNCHKNKYGLPRSSHSTELCPVYFVIKVSESLNNFIRDKYIKFVDDIS